jgi:ceramide glucosyltransferase
MEIFRIFAGITVLGLAGYGFQIWAVRSTLNGIGNGIGKGRGKGKEMFSVPVPVPLPGISVLKPLKGLDDNLFDNLESIFIQDYPQYEVIFSLQDHNDPAFKVARKIKDKYPDKDITIIVERCNPGLNPKVNNLIPAYKIAKFEHVLISDSNVMVNKDYLQDIVKHMEDPDVGLVSNIIKGTGGRTFGAIFENLHLNSFVMGSVCFLDKFLKMPCVVGKSMLMRKQDIEAIGGFRAVKDVLAENYLIGKKLHQRGKKVVLSNHIIRNVNEYWGIKKFFNRHTRWGKLRWKIGGVRYFSELFSNAVFMSFLPLILWEPSKITVSFPLLVSSAKILGDLYISRIIEKFEGNGESDENNACSLSLNPLWYLLSPVKDLIVGLIWFVPILSTTVAWRGNRYTIGKDSALSPCPGSGIWSWRYRFFAAIKARFA